MNKEFFINKETEPRPSYIVTMDVQPLVRRMCEAKGWRAPEAAVFRTVDDALKRQLANAFPQTVIDTPSAEYIADRVTDRAKRQSWRTGLPVVTMDPLYGAGAAEWVHQYDARN